MYSLGLAERAGLDPSLRSWYLEVPGQSTGGFSRAGFWRVEQKWGAHTMSKVECVAALRCCVSLRAPRTYPRPSERQELPFSPVVTFDVEQTSNHDEDPNCQVNDIEHVVQSHRVLHPHGHNDGDNDSNDQSKKVRVRLLSFP